MFANLTSSSDQNRHGLSQSIGDNEKIWLFYPPTEENLRIFTQSSGETSRLTKISSQLHEGLVAQVDSTKVVYIPPGWIHATFTTQPGTLVGINFSSLECLPVMAESLGIHSTIMFRLPGDFSDDFSEYQSAVASFLSDEHEPRLLGEILSSWICLHRTLQNTAQFRQTTEARQVFKGLMESFCKVLKIGTVGKRAACCEKQHHDLYHHIQQHHSPSDLLN